ncbi:asparagine synthase-related protein [Ktedonobacter racemifer]|uniref:asparagine synthase-related protein n=1 Tax=Ktedonobacter racemifer TaxID=363277 RepID=UPI0002EC85E3|nr:asparagine synthase-related protein [Ktedonobacter racemifer]
MADDIEKGILRRAFASVLPEDVIRRKKSAYPNAQNPLYEKATREWALHILHDPNAPIHPLLDEVKCAKLSPGAN